MSSGSMSQPAKKTRKKVANFRAGESNPGRDGAFIAG
jgi:hypothetical protein